MYCTVISSLRVLFFISHVRAHGFLFGLGQNQQTPSIRGIEHLRMQIDLLRTPLTYTNLCRGEPVSLIKTPLTLGLTMSVTLAISAAHNGPCAIQINGVTISPLNANCVSTTTTPACVKVPGSTTNDMCLHTWTFATSNLDQVKCTDNCVLRWTWSATHLSVTDPEMFENCIDVSIPNGLNAPPSTPPVTAIDRSTLNLEAIHGVSNYDDPRQSPKNTELLGFIEPISGYQRPNSSSQESNSEPSHLVPSNLPAEISVKQCKPSKKGVYKRLGSRYF